MKPKPLPPATILNEAFRLDHKTGHLYWRKRPRHHFVDKNAWARTTARVYGKRADKPDNRGYLRVRINIKGKSYTYSAHRVVWKMVHGNDPIPEVDHIDRNPKNNIPSNLREVTRRENVLNSDHSKFCAVKHPSQIKFPGYRKTKSGKFSAQIVENGYITYLGTFETEEAASNAVLEARTRRFNRWQMSINETA